MATKSNDDKSVESVALLHDNTRSPRDERRERGKALRAAIPHKSHAGWRLPPSRPNPIDALEESNAGRLEHLIPIRYSRMLPSPFTFYRGSAALMAYDLSTVPSTTIKVQACGDCHLLNFGAFATPERNIVFDLNDFDETLPAPWEWDIKRLAVSFVLSSRENELKSRYETDAARAVVRAYREKIDELSRKSILEIWYDRIDWQSIIEKTSSDEVQKERKRQLKKVKQRSIQDYYFPKMVREVAGGYRIKDYPPLIYHPKAPNGNQLSEMIRKGNDLYKASLQEDKRRLYERYKLEDIAVKVVGVGSVGTRCFVALLLAPDNEPLFLQIKEARKSVLEPYTGSSPFKNEGERVVAGQRIIQSASDIFLGWTELDNGTHFYVRQLKDMKVKLRPDLWDGPQLTETAQLMGSVLARAHARSGDAAFISGYLGEEDSFDASIADFAVAYADQVEKDHSALVAAVGSGRIKVSDEEY